MNERKSKGTLVGLAALFFLPLGLSFLLYYGSGWRPTGHTNHGTLIEPARPLPDVPVLRAGTQVKSSAVLSAKWSLVYVGDGACDTDCRNTLHYVRQTDFGMGSLMPRLQRVFLATDHCCDQTFLQQEDPGLITLNGLDIEMLTANFPSDRQGGIFIVDPRGNLMMRYDVNADPKGLREDLKKLLNLSSIG